LLPYSLSDGSSFSSYRQAPWKVKPNALNTTQLVFRGVSNLDRTLDALIKNYGLGEATDVILSGGSAGGLSTFLHLDRVAARLPDAKVVGAPVAGYFTDQKPVGADWINRYGPDEPPVRPLTSWPAQMQYMMIPAVTSVCNLCC